MKEKIPDLNQMRDQIAKLKELSNEIPDNNEMSENVNTLERFEALPIEEQVQRMEQKGYTDLELFKVKHYGKGGVRIDINKLRDQIKNEEKRKDE